MRKSYKSLRLKLQINLWNKRVLKNTVYVTKSTWTVGIPPKWIKFSETDKSSNNGNRLAYKNSRTYNINIKTTLLS